SNPGLDSYGNRRFYGVNDKKEGISYIMDNNKQRLCHAVKHLTPVWIPTEIEDSTESMTRRRE
ncbi:hypothetical protein, partial [Elizabethkingia meningoseptica]|uniref:hypothetical protein n=2 Tax=Elizabethkingia meningoseptica TaxID=238 RepID=UPI00318F7D74